MTDNEKAAQEIIDIVERHTQERKFYGGQGLGSPLLLVFDIRAWFERNYPDLEWPEDD